MSSAAILAMIRQKEGEMQQLNGTNSRASVVYNAVDCMATKLKSAGSLMSEAGTIDGMPFDNGATSAVGETMKNISNNTQELIEQIKSTIAGLQGEIEGLWGAYYAALAREQAEAAEMAKRNNRM